MVCLYLQSYLISLLSPFPLVLTLWLAQMLIVDFYVFSYSLPRIHIAASLFSTAKCFQTICK